MVGCSLAGVRAAEELRRLGFGGRLDMIGEEDHFPPFDRPPLSKEVLSGSRDITEARLRLFTDLHATMVLGRRAVALHATANEVELDDGATISYDGLVIATGTSVRRIACEGSDLAGIYYFRRAEDCAQVLQRLQAQPRVAVVGGGFIGSEVAAVCRARGLDVTIVDLLPLPMVEQVGQAAARYLLDQHVRHGITMRLGVGVAAFEGAGEVRQLRLTDGSVVAADVVIVGIGVKPETAWLQDAGLVLDNGVVCDQHCAPLGGASMVAAGDVARWFNPAYGTTMRVEHWTNAVEQAEYAAGALLGIEGREGYRSVPYFWSDQYDMHLQMAGIQGPEAVVVEGSSADRKFVMMIRDGGRDVGVLCVNWPARFQRYRRQLKDHLASAGPVTAPAPGSAS